MRAQIVVDGRDELLRGLELTFLHRSVHTSERGQGPTQRQACTIKVLPGAVIGR